jgi:hydrogenase expression/formation protein HypD
MKYVDEFRDPEKARFLLEEIRVLVPRIQSERASADPIYIMEVCGGHTHAIFRYGVETMLPKGIELIHGPGCPVCVLPMGRVDDCVALAHMPGMIFTTFGEPCGPDRKSLLQAANGADVRMVYSPLDSLRLPKRT